MTIPPLNDCELKRTLQQNEIAELCSLWQAGLKSGSGRHADMEAIKAEARKRLSSDIPEKITT